jgi:2-keto-3-deoxy-L-fuconate dehydrogenase
MFSLENKTAIITGGASGIGKAIVQLFAKQGATVHSIDSSYGTPTAAQVNFSVGNVFAHPCDVSDHEQVMKTIDGLSGRIDILVNNAGIAHVGNVENTLTADFEKIFAVNVKGMYNCLHAVVPRMKKEGGVIVNMASVASWVGLTDRFAYSMSKGAVASMTLSVARDYLPYNIRCNSISPARVHTPFVDGFITKNYPGKEKEMLEKLSKSQPIGRMATPEEVAHLALYLCSDEASFVTGSDFPIDGGFMRLNT